MRLHCLIISADFIGIPRHSPCVFMVKNRRFETPEYRMILGVANSLLRRFLRIQIYNSDFEGAIFGQS